MKRSNRASTAMTYMFWGLLFGFISIDYDALMVIKTVLSMVLLFQGTCMLHNEHKHFYRAWIVCCCYMLILFLLILIIPLEPNWTVPLKMISNVLYLLLMFLYFSGLYTLREQKTGNRMMQCRLIILEYFIYVFVYHFLLPLPNLWSVGIVINILLAVGIMAQVYWVHRQVRQADPMLLVSNGVCSTAILLVLCACVVFVGIAGVSYSISTSETIQYQERVVSKEKERKSLIAIGVPEMVVNELLDEDVTLLMEVATVTNQYFEKDLYQITQTIALSKDKNTMYIIVSYALPETLTSAHASFFVNVNQSKQNSYLVNDHTVSLYDIDGKTMAYVGEDAYEFVCKGKKNLRGYLIAEAKSNDGEPISSMFDIEANLWYEPHWLQYPNQKNGLVKAIQKGKDSIHSEKYQKEGVVSAFRVSKGEIEAR